MKKAVQDYNRTISGENYQEAKAKVSELKEQYSQVKQEVILLRQEKTGLEKIVQELKNWFSENILKKYEHQFANRHKDEFDRFVKDQERNRGRGR